MELWFKINKNIPETNSVSEFTLENFPRLEDDSFSRQHSLASFQEVETAGLVTSS